MCVCVYVCVCACARVYMHVSVCVCVHVICSYFNQKPSQLWLKGKVAFDQYAGVSILIVTYQILETFSSYHLEESF